MMKFTKDSIVIIILISGISLGQNQYNDQLIVKMASSYYQITTTIDNSGNVLTNLSTLDQLNITYNCQGITSLYRGSYPEAQGLYIFKFDQDTDLNILSSLYTQNSYIESAIPDQLINIGQNYPNDPAMNQEDGLEQMDASEAWDINVGSANVIISINDTGVDYMHPDLGENMWQNLGEDIDGDGKVLQQTTDGTWEFDPGDINGIDDDNNGYEDDFVGWDFRDDDYDPIHEVENASHGTKVAGTATEVGNNDIGGVGVSWHSKIMATRTGRHPYISLSAAIAAIYYSIDNNANIINMSWGSTGQNSDLYTALTAAQDSNLVLVAAAMHTSGGGTTTRWYPAAWDIVIGVTAVNLDDTKQDIVQYGDWIDVAAPRFDYKTIFLKNDPDPHQYAYTAGATSTASPFTAGLAALILSTAPNASNEMVRSFILNTADNIDEANQGQPWEGLMGSGRINAHIALSMAGGSPSVPTNFYGTGGHGQNPTLHFDPVVEPDIAHLELHRTIIGQGGGNTIFTLPANSTQYTDNTVVIDRFSRIVILYELKSVDVSDQESGFTNRVKYRGEGLWKQMVDFELIPDEYALYTAYPNPFNPITNIKIDIPENSHVKLTVFDLSGRVVAELMNKNITAGTHQTIWNGKDNKGRQVSSGVYLYTITAKSNETGNIFTQSNKMVLLK